MKKIKNVPKKVEKVVETVTEMSTEIVDEPGGWEPNLGKRVLIHCMNYNYSGILCGVNTTTIELSDASVVFETGPYTNKTFKDAQKTPSNIVVQLSAVECHWVIE